MAKSHHNGDSSFPSPLSEYPGISGSSGMFPAKPTPFRARPAAAASSMPTPYILKDGAAMHIGKSMYCSRRLRDIGATNATPRESEPLPTTTSID
jgi:hypothetical protein